MNKWITSVARMARDTNQTDRPVFVTLTGDYPNIGDALIRRRSLAWARLCGDSVSAFVGRAPDMWCVQVGLQDDDSVYRQKDLAAWIAAIAKSPRGVTLVLEPGEVDLRLNQYKWECLVLLFTLLVKLKGGRIVRPPRSLSRPSRALTLVHAIGLRMSDTVLWREARSEALVRQGQVAPDIAFSEPQYGSEASNRRRLIVSLRGLRPSPSDAWLEGVRGFAQDLDLEITVVAQVRQDEIRTVELADALGGECVSFGDRDDLEQERLLRSVYRESVLVISDRLHVLILAALGGALPCEVVPAPSAKVRDHFAAAGIKEVSFDAEGGTADEVRAFLRSVYVRRTEILKGVEDAHRQLKKIESALSLHRKDTGRRQPSGVQG
ncbi:hypothetical protein [Kocuria sp. CH-021]|uniref:hypothetical protein n=1 Tax=Kocuria sp. CH-021 TaxID=3406735 RepID=UPI003C70B4FD